MIRRTLLVIGPVFLVVSTLSIALTIVFLRSSVRTEGYVSSLAKQVGNEGSVTDMPVFDFTDAQGLSHQISGSVASNPASFHVGERVSVIYGRSNPAQARIDTTGQIWGLSIGFAVAAFVVSVLGYALLRFERWQARKGCQ